jgi:hypothetical protein
MSQSKTKDLLNAMEHEALAKAAFNMHREGMFRGVLKASFIKCFEFAKLVHGYEIEKAEEGSFFLSGALRGLSEDLIALKFIRKLKRKDRDEVVQIEMMSSTAQLIDKQAEFFRSKRPFQPVLTKSFDAAELDKAKDRLTTIGQSSKLWQTSRKLPPIEQMANVVRLKAFYNFIYRMTSRIVHFNVGVALRSGWGDCPKAVTFSSRNFCRYYLELNQFYGAYILVNFCRTFGKDLGLSSSFMKNLAGISSAVNDRLRWPEAITFEEMNQRNPNVLIRIVLKVAHLEKKKNRARKSLANVRAQSGAQSFSSLGVRH